MNESTCRAAVWAGHVDRGHVDRGHVTCVARQSLGMFSVKFSAAPLASRPDLVNISGGLCWYLDEVQSSVSPGPDLADDAWCWCWGNDNEEVASSLETWNMPQPTNWGKLSEDGLFMMGYLHNCNAEAENIYVHALARCKSSPSPIRNDKTCRWPLLPNLPTLQRFPESNWTSRSSSQQQPTFSTGSKLNSRKLK